MSQFISGKNFGFEVVFEVVSNAISNVVFEVDCKFQNRRRVMAFKYSNSVPDVRRCLLAMQLSLAEIGFLTHPYRSYLCLTGDAWPTGMR